MGKPLVDDRAVGCLIVRGDEDRWGKFRYGVEINPETKLVTKTAAPLKFMIGWTLHGVETFAKRKGWGVDRKTGRSRGRLLNERKAGRPKARTAQKLKTKYFL